LALIDATGATNVVDGIELLVSLLDETVFEPPVDFDAEVYVPDVEADVKLASVVLGPVFNGTVVSPLTITLVVPSMTVVLPSMEKFGLTGIVVGPLMTNSVVPSMTVSEPGRSVGNSPGMGIVVAPGMIRYGVPFMVVVVAPGNPQGNRESGIDVADGRTRKGIPFMRVVVAPGIACGKGLGRGTVVGPGMMMNGVPEIMVVLAPVKSGGAFAAGIVVAEGITRNGVPFMSVVLPALPLGPAAGSGMLVVPGTTMKGVLLMTVKLLVRPGGASPAGMFAGPAVTAKVLPPITVVRKAAGPGPPRGWGAGNVVGPGTTMNEVLSMTVVGPTSPGGAFPTGILVDDGITMKGEPPIIVTLAPGMTAGEGTTAANVVSPGTTTNDCPLISVV
jgi:hypothetical protein